MISPQVDGPKASDCNDLRQSQTSSAAPGAAVDTENGPIDAELQSIIERWPELPGAVKAGILAMIHAAGE